MSVHVHVHVRKLVLYLPTGVILAFGVSRPKDVSTLATQKKVTILSHKVIYKLLDQLKVRVRVGVDLSVSHEVH